MFSGLAQTGAWTCLDEFNRIEVEVLSVVATQIATVMQAIKESRKRFIFLGQEIRLIPTCGIFVTMNPGYAGRSELPDNLKAILRPVSMMVPDFTLIAEIMMFSEGFSSAKVLAKKMIAIMELSQQQLSKQDHYDYGLRSFVIPIARAAGSLKRVDPDASEEVILYRTMLDLIKPKLVYLDLPLFMALLSDLFPGVELPAADGGSLKRAIEAELREHNLQVVPEYITKIIQVFDCKVARHGNMIVGKTGSGKSEAWKALQRALARLKKEEPEEERYQKVHVHTINPLALSNDELYGSFDQGTHEWQDGVLARIMRTVCKDESLDQKWILFDGPVDTLWIESMNTTLDDNKLLTLLSGERIAMTPQVSLLFEVEDLSQASPATVSRAGMIYLNVEDLGWRPFITSWLATKQAKEPAVAEALGRHIDKYMDMVLEHKRLHCRELVVADRLACVRSFTRLFDALATAENGVAAEEGPEAFNLLVEMWFLFCIIWGIGGPLDEDGRKKFDVFMREQDTRYPSSETVFEYYVDVKTRQWVAWENKLSASYKPAPDLPFFKILVPTVDTVRNKFVASALVKVFQHTLIVGNVGVGKTMIVQSMLDSIPGDRTAMTINFSAQTSSNSLQDTIEGKLEKRTKGVFAPAGGKKLVCFIDDLNMPQKSKFGFIPPLELLKLWVDNGFWYDRQKCEVKYVKDMQLLAAMAPPGGGRNHFSQRVGACFSTINVTSPNDSQLKRIFGTILNSKLADFDDEVKPLADPITSATIAIYRAVSRELLPTPSKSHYLFNTRDLAKVIQGMMQATKTYYNSRDELLQLWCHEACRIIADRMWDANDKEWLRKQLDEKLLSSFSTSYSQVFEAFGEQVPPFVTFMRQGTDAPPYEPVRDMAALKELLTEKLEDYALEPGASSMDLVLFRDALHHICRIHRILCQPRGNALLVGVGGSGRKSLSRLATFVAELKCFTIEITKNYRITEFREDLKGLTRQAGCANKPTVFLFDETQIVFETFLEDVNNILTSGEVPNLFPKDELGTMLDEVRAAAKAAGAGETQEALYAFWLERVRTNLHVILCLSPVGDTFRERCRMFPGLVNCTTIDWFTEWPADALFEVASKQLSAVDLGSAEVKANVCKVFVTAHQSVEATSAKMAAALKRKNYVTPTNYLETVRGYVSLLAEKRRELGDKANKLKGGLEKLAETSVQVAAMKKVAEEKKVVVAQAKTDCEELLVEIVQDKRVADEQEKQVNAEAMKIGKEAEEANLIASQVQTELDKALPALQAAEEALNVLTKKDMSELKAYAKPPALVELTLAGVMTVLRRPATWDEAKKQLGDASFMTKLLEFDKDKLDDSLLKKIGKFTVSPEFTPEAVGKVSLAARGLCLWVRSMETYGHVAKEVAPKRLKLKMAQDTLAKKQAALRTAQEALATVLAKVQALKNKYDDSTGRKRALEEELSDLEGKLERAEKLVTGLAGERVRWEGSISDYEAAMTCLPGDVVLASSFLSYAGPFPSEYRDDLVKHTWLPQVKALAIPASEHFDFALFLADPKAVRDWNIQGLPSDSFSTENGVMVTRGRRWPLMIDPQGQANKWVKNMEKGPGGLKVLNLQMADMARQVENAIQFGNAVLLQDVLEEMDPILEPVLAKSFIKRGNQLLIKLGDKEVDYNKDFRLYITTKLANPHYTPEISTKVMIVNFAVKEAGLEAQLLAAVVRAERPDLDKQKNDLVVKVAAGKRTQVAEENSRKIEAASQAYRPCSVRASVLYFVLNDLATIDPMYQFSLDAYNDLFLISIRNSPRSDVLQDRIKSLNEYH
ncbi:dynein-1, subspecies f, partial [Haematococcus lacustris]